MYSRAWCFSDGGGRNYPAMFALKIPYKLSRKTQRLRVCSVFLPPGRKLCQDGLNQ